MHQRVGRKESRHRHGHGQVPPILAGDDLTQDDGEDNSVEPEIDDGRGHRAD